MISLDNLGGTIYYKDTPVVEFKYKRDVIQFIGELNKDCVNLPFEFCDTEKVTDHLIRCFFEARIVPETRIGLNEVLSKTKIQYYNPERIIRYQEGRCIHDQYWLQCDNDETCWE